MKFRRRSTSDAGTAPGTDPGPDPAEGTDPRGGSGPWDVADVGEDGVERVDLGSLLLPPEDGREVRLQVDEASGAVQAVLLAGPDGAMDVRAFAASRNGDLWDEVRPQIAADMAQRGGTATEREGRFGPELVCEVRVLTPEGQPGVQHSRILGVNGPRWMLRATFIGRPATDAESGAAWEECLSRVVVRRGDHAVPPGEPLPLRLPEQARRVDQPTPDPRSALADRSDAGDQPEQPGQPGAATDGPERA